MFETGILRPASEIQKRFRCSLLVPALLNSFVKLAILFRSELEFLASYGWHRL
jgi:hypothetical protein